MKLPRFFAKLSCGTCGVVSRCFWLDGYLIFRCGHAERA